MTRASLTAATLASAVLVLAACSGGGSPRASVAATPAIPGCAAASLPPQATPPPGFPAGVPLPPGTYITGGRASGGELVLDAIVPSDLSQAAAFMTRELPAAGLGITSSDAEQDEAEARFTGSGISGRFRLHGITGCNGAVTFSVAVSTT
jgi:hypothetical protein